MIATKHYRRTRMAGQLISGSLQPAPTYDECRYYHDGREIARYTAKNATLYLRTSLLAAPSGRGSGTRTYQERMEKSDYAELWAELLTFAEMDGLDIGQNTALSEYTPAEQ